LHRIGGGKKRRSDHVTITSKIGHRKVYPHVCGEERRNLEKEKGSKNVSLEINFKKRVEE